MRYVGRTALALAAVALIGAAPPAPPAQDPINRLEWLAGCWQGERPGRLTEEQWMAPAGGSMVGMSRTVVEDRTVAHEYLRIESVAGQLRLIAAPSGQAQAEFGLLELGETSVAFSNPEHDFPQVIRYILQPDGSLLGRIEGEMEGRARVVDFPLRRTPCAGADD